MSLEIHGKFERKKNLQKEVLRIIKSNSETFAIRKLLRDKNARVRYITLKTLVFTLNFKVSLQTCKKILQEDREEQNRGLAAACIGKIYRGTKNVRALESLLKTSYSEKVPWIVRYTAYTAYYDVLSDKSNAKPFLGREFDNKHLKYIEYRLRALHKSLKTNRLPKSKITDVIYKLGKYHFLEAKKEIEKFLDSEDYLERHAALITLVLEWGLRDYRNICEKFLLNDPDEDMRSLGASCLGSVLRRKKDKAALKLLLKIFKDEHESPIVRESSYNAIFDILGVPYYKRLWSTGELDFKNDVDWVLIARLERKLRGKHV